MAKRRWLLNLLMMVCLTATAQDYNLPTVPDSITDITARADYATAHYWEHYDFCDTTLLQRGNYAEQAVADFLGLLAHTSTEGREVAVRQWLDSAAQQARSYTFFADMARKYLYDPDSPLYDEQAYQLVLQHVLHSGMADVALLTRSRFEWQLAQRNQVGEVAADFAFRTADGRQCRLSTTATDRLTLLLFYDPGCERCQSLLFRLRHSSAVKQAISDGRLTLLAVCTGDDETQWRNTELPDDWLVALDESDVAGTGSYDLRSMPQMFLLDPGKRVLLRSTDFHEVVLRLAETEQ